MADVYLPQSVYFINQVISDLQRSWMQANACDPCPNQHNHHIPLNVTATRHYPGSMHITTCMKVYEKQTGCSRL